MAARRNRSPLLPSNQDNLKEEIYVVGIPLHSLSKPLQLCVCVCGVMVFYLLYGYVQEWIFRIEGFKLYGWYLTLVQFAFYSLFGIVEMSVTGDWVRRIPFKVYVLLAFLTVSTMGLSNTSLGYLNYPTQVIFKCCKLIPVMFGSVLIQGKKYGCMDFLSVTSMSVGLVLFILADTEVQPNFDGFGVLLISLALCADAVIGNVQERAMKEHLASNREVVFFSYSIGFFYILLGLAVTGELTPAVHFSWTHAGEVYTGAFVFSVTGYLGISFVLQLVRLFGALLAVTVTTFRKAASITLSFLVFTKPFTTQYVWAGLIVGLGVLLNVYQKNKTKINAFLLKSVPVRTKSFSV